MDLAAVLRDAERLDQFIPATGDCTAVAAPIVAVAVFFHLFQAPAANFVGALPMRREGVFATAFTAGYAMLTAPLIVVSLITLAVEAALGVLAPGAVFSWLGACMLQNFFWFSFATLCCVISGNAVASVCFYVIFNGVVVGMAFLVEQVLGAFLYGFDRFSDQVWKAVLWLTPIYQTSLSDNSLAQSAEMGRFEMLWIYAAVGFLMLLAALGLHHIRKAERSGDLIAFGPIRWVFRISVTLCGGLSFGMMLMSILFWDEKGEPGVLLAGCCVVAAVVSWFAAEMLLQKSFKVFRDHWKGAVVGALCFVLAISAIDMDWIGFTRRVPRPEQVKSARAVFYGGDADPIATEGLAYDSGNVQAIIDLHTYLVQNKDVDSSVDYCYGRLEVSYDLGLTQLRRNYSFYYPRGGALDGLYAAAQTAGVPAIDLDRGNPIEGDGSVYMPESGDLRSFQLTPAEAEAAWTAVREDIQAGRYRVDGSESSARKDSIELCWLTDGKGRSWQTFYPRESSTSMNAFLDEIRAKLKEQEEQELQDQEPQELPEGQDVPLGGGEEAWETVDGQDVLVSSTVTAAPAAPIG